jgi:hypothetical protein
MKWSGTVLCLVGIALTSLNIYPLNLYFGFIGSLLWTVAGIQQKDYPLIIVEFIAVLMYLYGIVTV